MKIKQTCHVEHDQGADRRRSGPSLALATVVSAALILCLTAVLFYHPKQKDLTKVGSEDATMRLWDAQSGKLVAVLSQNTDTVLSARFSPDGAQLVTTSQDGTTRVWDVQSHEAVKTPKTNSAAMPPAKSIPGTNKAVTASQDGSARIWDAQTGKPLTGARIWDARTGELLTNLPSGSVTSVWFSPDGKQIITSSPDGTVRKWDAPKPAQ